MTVESFEYDISPDEVKIHWQHPRMEVEHPVLLVWPNPLRDKWAAEIDDGTAWVVCHTTLYEDDEGDVDKISRRVNPNEPVPHVVAEALLQYEGNYGPVEAVANPYAEPDSSSSPPSDDDQKTL